jgi:hypothetical protein
MTKAMTTKKDRLLVLLLRLNLARGAKEGLIGVEIFDHSNRIFHLSTGP